MRLNNQTWDEVKLYIEDGNNVTEASKKFNVSRRAIYVRARDNNWDIYKIKKNRSLFQIIKDGIFRRKFK